MPRNITAAQKRVRDFHKDDVLVQTNQIKYDCFFLHSTENIKKLFSQDLKLETKILGTFFQILYCSIISQWKNSVKHNLVKLELSKEIRSPEYPDLGSKF